jgi:hypothetical protein
MGNQSSAPVSQNIPTGAAPGPETMKLVNIKNKIEVDESEEYQIISQMTQISHDIMLEYVNLHLDKDFCNNLAIIYANKLEKFKIPLKEIHAKLNNGEIDDQLLLVYRSGMRDDERYIVGDEIKTGLEDLFWNEKIKFNPGSFENFVPLDSTFDPKEIFKSL